MSFRVWAPAAGRVDLVLGDARHAMARAPGGWWESGLEAAPGTDYAFSLDGGPPLPDPRSPWQPHGVHGASRTVDPRAFPWTDAGWRGFHLPSAVLYELHVGTFTPEGTFDAAIDRLDALVELGVTAVELLPVAQFPGRHGWGYDGVDLCAPHESYGGPAGLARLVDACHARGRGVLLDVVYNHLGPDGNYLRQFGPYFTDRYHTPWGDAVNLDGAGSDEVRALFLDNACQWLRDYHVDGLRIDAVHAFFDRSAVHFLEALAVRAEALSHALGRPLWLVAESDLNDPRLVRSRDAGGYGLHASWSDDFHHALHAALTGERGGYYEDFGGLAPVARALERVYVYDGRYSPHRDRTHGRPATGLPGTRFLGYLQNHDQVGNRARGERTSHLLSPGRLAVGAALVLAAPFVPMLFQGEEWGASTPFPYFCDHADPELARAVREGRRREFAAFGWDPEAIPDPGDPATFASAKLRWDERDRSPHRALLAWHCELIALRRATPALADGRLDRVRASADDPPGTLRLERGPVLVAANLADAPRRIPAGDRTRLLAAWDGDTKLEAGALALPPASVAIVA